MAKATFAIRQLSVGSLGPALGRVDIQIWECTRRSAHGQGHSCECCTFCSGSSVLAPSGPPGLAPRFGNVLGGLHMAKASFANVARFVRAALLWLPRP